MALAFALLLVGPARRFLALAARQVALVLALAFVLGSAGLLERDGDRLAAALDLAALARAAALQLAVCEFVHNPARRLALAGRLLGSHGSLHVKMSFCERPPLD